MSCRENRILIGLAQDGALPAAQRIALERHLSGCADCRRWQAALIATARAVQTDAAAGALPDVDEEIHGVQARLRQTKVPCPRKLAPILWLGAPLAAAAAAIALAVIPSTREHTPVSHVDYVVSGNPDAATMVYVDQASGWLVVWASSPAQL